MSTKACAVSGSVQILDPTEVNAKSEGSWCGSTPLTGLVYDTRMCEPHQARTPHVECPERLTSIYSSLCATGTTERCARVPSRMASLAELRSVHTESHIMKMLKSASMSDYQLQECARTYDSVFLSPGSCSAGLIAAGSLVELTNRVIEGQLRNGSYYCECGRHLSARTQGLLW